MTDPAKTQVIAVVNSCNACHEKLALHGGGRVDVQYCVMCHNPGTTDANSGNVLTMSTMVHKIHSGRLLSSQLAKGGEHYPIWGYQSVKHDYSEVGYPAGPAQLPRLPHRSQSEDAAGRQLEDEAEQGSVPDLPRERAGLDVLHDSHRLCARDRRSNAASRWIFRTPACAECHRVGTSVSPERVHWNQTEDHAAKYKVNIESATYDPAARKVTVKYSCADPTNNNAR